MKKLEIKLMELHRKTGINFKDVDIDKIVLEMKKELALV